MLTFFKRRPSIVVEAQKAQSSHHFIIQILIFLAVFLVTQLLSSIPLSFYLIAVIFIETINGNVPSNAPETLIRFIDDFIENGIVLPMLYCTVITSLLVIVYCKFIERRSAYSMGFVRKKAFTDYLKGICIGLLMISIAVLIAFVYGTLTFEGFVLGNGLPLLAAFLGGFIIQGMSEEVLLRGYFMVTVASRRSILLAILSNSIIFSLIHFFNNGIDVLPLINLALFGIFASIYTLKMDSIWGICAIHSIWNFAQGNIYGIRVSGINTQVSLFSFKSKEIGSLINGGEFGLEGGLAVTIVLFIGILILLNLNGRGVSDGPEIQEDIMQS